MKLQNVPGGFWLSLLLIYSVFFDVYFAAASPLNAAPQPVIISDTDAPAGLFLTRSLSLFRDPSHQETLASVVSHPALFLANGERIPNYGFSDADFWIKIELQSKATRTQNLALEVPYPPLDQITFFELPNQPEKLTQNALQDIPREHCGDSIAFSTRRIAAKNCVFSVNLAPQENKTVIMKIQSQGSIQIPVRLWDLKKYHENDHHEQIFSGIFYGIMLLLIFYHLFIFYAAKDISYLYFVCFLFFVTLQHASIDGIGFEFIWSHLPIISNLMMPLSLGLLSYFLAQFSAVFLAVSSQLPRFHGGIQVLKVCALTLAITSLFTPYSWGARIGALSALFTVIILVIAATAIWLKGYKPARLYVLSWLTASTGAGIEVLRAFGKVTANVFTMNSFQMGVGINVVLLSLALADRITLVRQAKEKAQQESTEHLQNLHRTLEKLLDASRLITAARNEWGAMVIALRCMFDNVPMARDSLVTLYQKRMRNEQTFWIKHFFPAHTLLSQNFQGLELSEPKAETCQQPPTGNMGNEPTLREDGTLFIPLIQANQMRGCVIIEKSSLALFPFGMSKAEQHFLGTIASSLSVTLENFSYNRDKEEQTKTLAELSAAKQVQLSLLPKLREYPGVTIANHLRSAQQTGGDWYSFGYDPVHNAMNFFIGDVTGHGVSAALLTGVAFGGISFGEYTVQKILPHQAPEDRLKILAQSVNTAI